MLRRVTSIIGSSPRHIVEHLIAYSIIGLFGALGIGAVVIVGFHAAWVWLCDVAMALWAGFFHEYSVPAWALALLILLACLTAIALCLLARLGSRGDDSVIASSPPARIREAPAPAAAPMAIPPLSEVESAAALPLSETEDVVFASFTHADGQPLHDWEISKSENLKRLLVQDALTSLIEKGLVDSDVSPASGEYFFLTPTGKRFAIEFGYV